MIGDVRPFFCGAAPGAVKFAKYLDDLVGGDSRPRTAES
jgi:hypothetical protein